MPSLPIYVAQQQARGTVAGATPGVVNMQPLVHAAAGMIDRARQEQHQQDVTRASEKLASAQLQWTQSEIERQTAYDPGTGRSYAADAMAAFGQYESKLLASASSEGEGEVMRRRMAAVREGVAQRSALFEAQAKAGFRRQALDTTLNQRTAAAELDPSQAIELMAQQSAEVSNSDQLSALERQELLATVRGNIATAAARTIAARDPQALQAHPVFQYIPASQLPGLMKQAQQSEAMIRTQTAADGLMTRGLPIDELMRTIERDYKGEDEKLLKAEVLNRYSVNEAAQRDREQKTYGTALLEVEQRGRVSPGTWSSLTDMHRAQVLNRIQAEAKARAAEAAGKPIKTDWDLYLDLRQRALDNPEEFGRMDLRQYVDRIGGAQLEQLADLKQRVNKPSAQREVATLSQQMTATLAAAKITNKQQRGEFMGFVQAEVDNATQAKGKPLTFDERQTIIDKAMLQGPDPDRILPWGERRMFQLTPDQRTRFKPNAPTDAPATEIDALNDALRAQGIPQTPANRLALYNRARSAAR